MYVSIHMCTCVYSTCTHVHKHRALTYMYMLYSMGTHTNVCTQGTHTHICTVNPMLVICSSYGSLSISSLPCWKGSVPRFIFKSPFRTPVRFDTRGPLHGQGVEAGPWGTAFTLTRSSVWWACQGCSCVFSCGSGTGMRSFCPHCRDGGVVLRSRRPLPVPPWPGPGATQPGLVSAPVEKAGSLTVPSRPRAICVCTWT